MHIFIKQMQILRQTIKTKIIMSFICLKYMTKLNNKDNFRFPLPSNFLISSVTGYYVTAQDLEMSDNYVKTFKDIPDVIQSILSVFPKKKEKVKSGQWGCTNYSTQQELTSGRDNGCKSSWLNRNSSEPP